MNVVASYSIFASSVPFEPKFQKCNLTCTASSSRILQVKCIIVCMVVSKVRYHLSTEITTAGEQLALLVSQRLSVRRCPDSGFHNRVVVEMPMTQMVFEKMFGHCEKFEIRKQFEATVGEISRSMPDGWSENSFITSTVCMIPEDRPIEVKLQRKRKVRYNHDHCKRCNWDGVGELAEECDAVLEASPYEATFVVMKLFRERVKKGRAYSVGKLSIPNLCYYSVPYIYIVYLIVDLEIDNWDLQS